MPRRFDAHYDGTSYRHVYRLDPRLLVPGLMLTLASVPLIIWTWPIPLPFAVTGIGLIIAALGLWKRQEFCVSPDGYRLSWSIGPFGSTLSAGPDEGKPFLVGGGPTYMIAVRCGWRILDPCIEAPSRREAEAWLDFLRAVSDGQPAQLPGGQETSLLR